MLRLTKLFGWFWVVRVAYIYMARYWTALELFQTKTMGVLLFSPFQIVGPCRCTLHACSSNLHHPFQPPILAGRAAVATYGGHFPLPLLSTTLIQPCDNIRAGWYGNYEHLVTHLFSQRIAFLPSWGDKIHGWEHMNQQ